MLYAIDSNEQKVRPHEEQGAVKDPFSGYPVTPKARGNTALWYAAEAPTDPWMLPYTEWAMQWRLKFPKEMVEVILKDGTGIKHVADVYTTAGQVLKFQHRFLTIVEMRQREQFFNKMIWVLNAALWDFDIVSRPTHYCDVNGEHLELPAAEGFEWIRYSTTRSKVIFQSCKCPVLLDLGGAHLHWLNWQGSSGLHLHFENNGGIVKTFKKEDFLKKHTK